MKDLPANLVFDKNRTTSGDPWILLLALTLPDSSVVRFARYNENVTFGGNLYNKLGFDIDTYSESNENNQPTFNIKVSNISQILKPYLRDNDGLVGCEITITVVSTRHLSEDHSELELTFDIKTPEIQDEWVIFTIGGPDLLNQRFPLYRYMPDFCQWQFESVECNYTRKTVADVTLSGTDPVSVEVTVHGFATGDVIRLAGINDITPDLAGSWIITKTDANNFTLDSTDSSDYSGSYSSGGTAGYATCNRNLTDCRDRENTSRFGACIGMKAGGVRVA